MRRGPGRLLSRATKEGKLGWLPVRVQSKGCDEIENKNRPFDFDIVILAWQTYTQSCSTDTACNQ